MSKAEVGFGGEDDLVLEIKDGEDPRAVATKIIDSICSQYKDVSALDEGTSPIAIWGGVSNENEIYIIFWKKILATFSPDGVRLKILSFFQKHNVNIFLTEPKQIFLDNDEFDDMEGLWNIHEYISDCKCLVGVVMPVTDIKDSRRVIVT